MDAPPPCEEHAPPGSFEPDVQWEWWGPQGYQQSDVIPLVANLTDDDDNGSIDLCDVPDVVVLAASGSYGSPGTGHVLDGETGTEHFQLGAGVLAGITPALGDLDDDGLPEIVWMRREGNQNRLVCFEHDGTVKWDVVSPVQAQHMGIAIGDMDNDGSPEIMIGHSIVDADGQLLWSAGDQAGPCYGEGSLSCSHTLLADLDDDGGLELVIGRSAWHPDGSEYWFDPAIEQGYPQVGDLDQDGAPEVLITGYQGGITLLEHDGTVKYEGHAPGGDPIWLRPATIHDFDGDGVAEYAVSSSNNFDTAHYGVFEGVDGATVWQTNMVDEYSGHAGSTAFDFLGDGSAEAMYADQSQFHVYDESGQVLMSVPRSSYTAAEYPVVADIDNDGSAEALVVSNVLGQGQTAPTIQAIRDIEDRWVPARRIWNQHTYHVTNVREDGTIPQYETPHWEQLNTFRTQAQFEGSVCQPEPRG
jgi:hypothetical protein